MACTCNFGMVWKTSLVIGIILLFAWLFTSQQGEIKSMTLCSPSPTENGSVFKSPSPTNDLLPPDAIESIAQHEGTTTEMIKEDLRINIDDLGSSANRHWHCMDHGLTDLECQAGYLQSGNYYGAVNGGLRKAGESPSVFDNYKNALNSAISKLPGHTGQVMRGETIMAGHPLHDAKVGETVTLHGFTSTSTNPEVATEFRIEENGWCGPAEECASGLTTIDIKGCVNGRYHSRNPLAGRLDKLSQLRQEDEIIVVSGAKMLVTGREKATFPRNALKWNDISPADFAKYRDSPIPQATIDADPDQFLTFVKTHLELQCPGSE